MFAILTAQVAFPGSKNLSRQGSMQ